MVAHGQVSVANAADLARCAVGDGMVHEAVKAFSSLGASGAASSNCERDMVRWLKNLFNFNLEPYQITLHLQALDLVLSTFYLNFQQCLGGVSRAFGLDTTYKKYSEQIRGFTYIYIYTQI